MHKSVIEAAKIDVVDDFAEARARRVIRAQAHPEAIPDEAIEEACLSLWQDHDFMSGEHRAQNQQRVRDAISAALLHIAGRE